MARRRRAVRSPLGSTPGTLPQNPHARPTEIGWIQYGKDYFRAQDGVAADKLALPSGGRRCWINVEGLQNQESLLKIGRLFGIHHLALEDIVVHQRAKLDHYANNALLLVPMPALEKGSCEFEQVTILFGKDYVISFQEGLPGDCFQVVRRQLETEGSPVRQRGSDYLAYRLLDAIIDHYFPLVDEIDERIIACEEEVFGSPGRDVINKIRQIKRDISSLERRIRPLSESLKGWERYLEHLTEDETRLEIRDCMDHARQLVDTLSSQKDLATGLIDDYISLLSFKTNEVMRALTVISVMFMPMTLIAGIYGMNFEVLPELKWRFGYPLALGGMLLCAAFLFGYFRRRGWIGKD